MLAGRAQASAPKMDLLPRAMSRKTNASSAQPASYGDAVQQLEQLIAGLESGQLPLEDLLGQYQRGTELLRYCRDRLQVVEDQVKVLDEEGTLKPWMPE
jgi:exodeoxyribonuclease VII small subunit